MTSQIVPTLDQVIGQTRAVAVLRTAIDSFFYDRTKTTEELAFPHLLISGPAVCCVISAVKSLFAFGHRLGYLPFDAARPLRLPACVRRWPNGYSMKPTYCA